MSISESPMLISSWALRGDTSLRMFCVTTVAAAFDEMIAEIKIVTQIVNKHLFVSIISPFKIRLVNKTILLIPDS